MKKISVIIPAYNAESTIKRTIDALISQRYEDLEIVIINDGSKDTTEEICLCYASSDSRIKYYYQNNAGVSAARNNGLLHATGQFIVFIDADDWVSDDFFANISENLDEDTVVVASRKTGEECLPLKNQIDSCKEICEFFLVRWAVTGVLFPKKILDDLFFDESVKIAEDLLFISHILIKNMNSVKLIYQPSSIYYYDNQRNGSAMLSSYNNNFLKGLETEVIVYESLKFIDLNYKRTLIIVNGLYQVFTRYFRLRSSLRKQYYTDYKNAREIFFRYFGQVIRNEVVEKKKILLILLAIFAPHLLAIYKRGQE